MSLCSTSASFGSMREQDKEAADGTEQLVCRLCWSTGDQEDGGCLVSPCSCSGSLKWIHERCLMEWQHTLRTQAQFKRAKACEVCKAPYHTPIPLHGRPVSLRKRLGQLLRRLNIQILDVFHSPTWAFLAYRSWKTYIFMAGVCHAMRLGATGLKAGVKVGHTLVAEQTAIMVQLLSTLAEFMGSPYAELLWLQAAAGVMLGLASEFMYASLFGMVAGMIYGFASGYVGAVHGSVHLVVRGCFHGLGLAARMAVKAARMVTFLPGASRIRGLV